MQIHETTGPLDIGALIERLDTAYRKGELSAADRIIEFPQVLKSLKRVYTKDLVEDRARHARVYSLLEELLDNMIEYKANLHDPDAATLVRPRSPSRQVAIVNALKKELRKHRSAENGERENHG